eukprot:scaffold31862_cov63-Phaeocystis_antarctica.AAC.15
MLEPEASNAPASVPAAQFMNCTLVRSATPPLADKPPPCVPAKQRVIFVPCMSSEPSTCTAPPLASDLQSSKMHSFMAAELPPSTLTAPPESPAVQCDT